MMNCIIVFRYLGGSEGDDLTYGQRSGSMKGAMVAPSDISVNNVIVLAIGGTPLALGDLH